jgi:hypothetical protein
MSRDAVRTKWRKLDCRQECPSRYYWSRWESSTPAGAHSFVFCASATVVRKKNCYLWDLMFALSAGTCHRSACLRDSSVSMESTVSIFRSSQNIFSPNLRKWTLRISNKRFIRSCEVCCLGFKLVTKSTGTFWLRTAGSGSGSHSVAPPSYDTVQPLTRLHGIPTHKTTI